MKITDSSCGGGEVSRLEEDLFGNPKAWPPGFRFHPTDEELILYYLKRKMCRRRLKLNVIKEIDVYKWDPEELPGLSLLQSRDRQWFFFTPRDRKYPNGLRSNRATRQGYWKATGKDRTITWNSRSVGVKKTLVFYRGRAPSGDRTDWVMHEYTMDENELLRCKNAQDYYALYKIFKKSGPGPKNGEQYGAPFREEDWIDDDVVVGNNTLNEVTQVHQNVSAPVDDLDELFRQICAEEETQNTTLGPSIGKTVYVEPVSCHPRQNLFDTHVAEEETLSTIMGSSLGEVISVCLPSCEAPEVTSAIHCSQGDSPGNEGVNFLELDDLEGPQQLGISSMISSGDNSCFGEIESLLESDIFFDASALLQDMGTINQSKISDPYDYLEGDFPNQSTYQTQNLFYDGEEVSGQLWMQDQRFNVSSPAESNHVIMNHPTSASVGISQARNSINNGEGRQNWDDNENGDIDTWCTSAISSFLGSVPTRPALATENVLLNRAFVRMSSFGRVVSSAIDSGAAIGGAPFVERTTGRVNRNGGLLFTSVLGVACAVLWMLMIGTTLKILGRFVPS